MSKSMYDMCIVLLSSRNVHEKSKWKRNNIGRGSQLNDTLSKSHARDYDKQKLSVLSFS